MLIRIFSPTECGLIRDVDLKKCGLNRMTTVQFEKKQGITNTLALPIDKMLYIYLLCPHSDHQKSPFQSKESKHFHQRNWFT